MNSRQSDLLSVPPQWNGVWLRGKEFGRLANYEMGKPRLGWEPGLNQPKYSPAVHAMQPANLDSPSKWPTKSQRKYKGNTPKTQQSANSSQNHTQMKDRDKAIERSFLRHEVKIEIVCEVKELQLIRLAILHLS